ncbi:hypothetical protein LH464_24220 [Neorhizobium sp. T786]|uniref:hypothetical protein n=1 Tax=Pseudorhizobium xiangyangii TaxID=2883104 RepID=UPI001D0015EC|nr:hypothetical protein [Neorhizobium xiangyangii]MCB5205545.1 hypothetical protein [Neorhizobium xiangyangii]
MLITRTLAGLPAYGPPAISFPKPNAFREGFVVEFTTNEGESWIGNFSEGWRKRPHCVHAAHDGRSVVVAAGGSGYFVDAEAKKLIREFDVEDLWYLDDQRMFLASTGLWFEMFDVNGVRWQSQRISWDGMRKFEFLDASIRGEAYDPLSDGWVPFELNLHTGDVVGGSYCGA